MAKKLIYNPNEKCKQAILFARVSSKRQKDEGISLEVQEKTIAQYCKQNGFKILDTFSIDESSTRGSRKKFHEMLDLAEKCNGKVAIVVNYVDRLQRTYTDTPILEQLRLSGKIEIHALRENLIITKDSPAMDLTVWYMHILMANFQVNVMIDKVKSSQKENWSLGKWLGLAPIGYINAKDDDRKATLIIDEQRAPIIKILFEEYATGLHSLQSLWYKARELGLISKEQNHYENSKNYNKRSYISRNKIEDILKNPFYYGVMKVKGQLIPHIYEPIISKELFDKVQTILKSKNKENFCKEQKYAGIPFSLRGLIKCECGCMMTPERHKKKGNIYTYLRCPHRNKDCKQYLVPEETILNQLNQEIFQKIRISPTMHELLKTSIIQSLEDEKKINANVRKKITDEIFMVDSRLERLWESYLDRVIDKPKYEAEKEKYLTQKRELEEKANKYTDITKELKENVEKAINFVADVSNLMEVASPDDKNMLLKRLLDNCVLHGDTLTYEIKAPFDKLISCHNYKQWSNVAIDNLDEFEQIKL